MAGKKKGVEGILGGLGELLSNLSELAEKGEQLKREGTFDTENGKKVNFTYGFKIKTAGDGDRFEVEPFGNTVERDERTGETRVAEIREPMVDVFEEDDHVLVIAEMPGVSAEHVSASVEGDILTLSAEHAAKRYRKEVLLPADCDGEPEISANNGVFELRLSRARRSSDAA